MKLLKYVELKHLFHHVYAAGISMRKRFALYIVSSISAFLALILLLLSLFGILTPTDKQILEGLDARLLAYTDNIESDFDQLAACAIPFANQLEVLIQKYLAENNLTFDTLRNNTEALTALQRELYDTVYLNMQISSSSGAFYILDTTVNSRSPSPLYSGIYLKYVNLYSENTVNNAFSLYRGSFAVGKENDVPFHSGWKNENRTDFFDHCDTTFAPGVHYVLSPVVEIPDTWEHARYVYVPIHNLKEEVIGVCGFEVSDLLFQLSQRTEERDLTHISYALLEETENGYSGQFTDNVSSFHAKNGSSLQLTPKKDFTLFDFGGEIYIGKTQEVQLGSSTFIAAVMMYQSQYQYFQRQGQLSFAIIFLIIGILAFLCCVFMSKTYVSPILKKFQQIKTSEETSSSLKIREIDDLFAFLEEKDTSYENRLKELEAAKQSAEEEALRSKDAYEKAMGEFEQLQTQLQQLSSEHKKDIVLEDYEYFLCNLNTLTPTEYKVYELYLAGKQAKEIAAILGIKENTLKFHNKNIYGKLGITSRKQLLQFAALNQRQNGSTDQPAPPAPHT